jgi:hypothetical protein
VERAVFRDPATNVRMLIAERYLETGRADLLINRQTFFVSRGMFHGYFPIRHAMMPHLMGKIQPQ